MTPAQREKVREVLHELKQGDYISYAIDAIAGIMAPQWLPVAGLVREILQGGLDNFDGVEINPSNYRHDDVRNLNDGYVGLFQTIEAALALLPAALPPKPEGDDAR
ncbi:MAG: hypothetical protein WCP82_11305 [Alphaproteobacteria bacterium]